MAVPVVDLPNNSDSSSDEDFSDSEVSYDESMEDEPSESEITTAKGTLITLSRFLILSDFVCR